MIIYITFSEYASGIFSGQVVDTCKELSLLSKQEIKIISFIHLKNFFNERKKLKNTSRNIIVLPSFPMMKNFRVNCFLLAIFFVFMKPSVVICRNAIPCKLGLILRKLNLVKKVVFDGRAAEYEQFVEYKLSNDKRFIEDILEIEKQAVLYSDFRIAVSEELVKYWNYKFEYNKNDYVVIPCTLNSKHLNAAVDNPEMLRGRLGFKSDDIILVYSGSVSQWQSFSELIYFFEEQIKNNDLVKVLFLCKETQDITLLSKKYSNRVKQMWCDEKDVFNYLSIADYGVLLRDETTTNFVASPVKFAEYLNAGLNVIISSKVGDFSNFVDIEKCGFVYQKQYIQLDSLTVENRINNRCLVEKYFNKKGALIQEKYKIILKNIALC
ncbi:MAG: hypothetical protein U0W65_05785 [Bacteroidia bacterium]